MAKKPAAELTDEEVIRKLFPKRVVEEAKREADRPEKRPPKPAKEPAKSAVPV